MKRLLDLAITRDLGRGADGRSDLDLRALDFRKPSSPLARGDPIVVHFLQILGDMLVVEGGGFRQGVCAAGIRLAGIVRRRLSSYRAAAVLHRIALMLGQER